jgi:hypothetical protein
MTPDPLIAQELERQSVVTMECTIPGEMTVDQWRQLRSQRRTASGRSARLRGTARKVVPLRPPRCDHLRETTTRYDHERKQLSFRLVCPSCGIEKLVETIPYEPRYEPYPVVESTPEGSQPARRAA